MNASSSMLILLLLYIQYYCFSFRSSIHINSRHEKLLNKDRFNRNMILQMKQPFIDSTTSDIARLKNMLENTELLVIIPVEALKLEQINTLKKVLVGNPYSVVLSKDKLIRYQYKHLFNEFFI